LRPNQSGEVVTNEVGRLQSDQATANSVLSSNWLEDFKPLLNLRFTYEFPKSIEQKHGILLGK
jgi:hypothetical protein